MSQLQSDTICAVATSSGKSGVGIVRVSGPLSHSIAKEVLGFSPKARYAHFSEFRSHQGTVVDKGIALFFAEPNSFTGEDVLELQGHGGNQVTNSLLKTVVSHGARLARPGEFSERAFLNGKIDLVQAEAIADLIDASTEQAAKSAVRTLQGEFSSLISKLLAELTSIRVNIEATIDFSDEDIEFVNSHGVGRSLKNVLVTLNQIIDQARQGALLKDGIEVVIAGKPNAGKSSLLNALSGQDSAIVTDIEGTTRDVLSEEISLDGLPLHITDTAGLRKTHDAVELEGVKRALNAVERADRVLLLIDGPEVVKSSEINCEEVWDIVLKNNFKQKSGSDFPDSALSKTTIIINKIDLIEPNLAGLYQFLVPINGKITEVSFIAISAKNKTGIRFLTEHLKTCAGFHNTEEGSFVARGRHLIALHQCQLLLNDVENNLQKGVQLELAAEDLRLAQIELGKITGEFTTDDLLGEIFSNFCVGK